MQTNLNLDIHSHAQLHQTLCLPRVYLPCLWYAYYHLIRELIFSVSCEIDVVFRLFAHYHKANAMSTAYATDWALWTSGISFSASYGTLHPLYFHLFSNRFLLDPS